MPCSSATRVLLVAITLSVLLGSSLIPQAAAEVSSTFCNVFGDPPGSLGKVSLMMRLQNEIDALRSSDVAPIVHRNWFNARRYNVEELLNGILTNGGCAVLYIADADLLLAEITNEHGETTKEPKFDLSVLGSFAQSGRVVLGFHKTSNMNLQPLETHVSIVSFCHDALQRMGYFVGVEQRLNSKTRCVGFLTRAENARADEIKAFQSGLYNANPAAKLKIVSVDSSGVVGSSFSKDPSTKISSAWLDQLGCSTYIQNNDDGGLLHSVLTQHAHNNFTVIDYHTGDDTNNVRSHIPVTHRLQPNVTNLAQLMLDCYKHHGERCTETVDLVVGYGCDIINADTGKLNMSGIPPILLPWCTGNVNATSCLAKKAVLSEDWRVDSRASLERVSLNTACGAGYTTFMVNGLMNCRICPVGTFRPNDRNETTCLPCDTDPSVGPGAKLCPSTNSGNAYIYIAIGIVIFCVLIAAATMIVLKRRRSKKAADALAATMNAFSIIGDPQHNVSASHSVDPNNVSMSQSAVPKYSEMIENGFYQQAGLVGKGAGASVFAVVLVNGKTIAMKQQQLTAQTSAKRRSRARRELAMMSRINCQHVTQYYGLRCTNAATQLFMEYVPGGTLKSYVTRIEGFLNDVVARRFATHLILGVKACHEESILHRDIKSDNVLVSPEGVLKVCDFGAAIRVEEVNDARAAGTPIYMAPELAKRQLGQNGGDDFSYASDVWALGLTVAEMCQGGELPLKRCITASEAFKLIAGPKMKLLFSPSASPGMIQFVNRCCQKDVTKRPSCADLLNDPWITGELSEV